MAIMVVVRALLINIHNANPLIQKRSLVLVDDLLPMDLDQPHGRLGVGQK